MNCKNISSYAKINLFLEVIGRLPDGYHLLQSVMHSVDISDSVTVSLNNSGQYTVNCSSGDIPPESNLAIKAAKCFYENSNADFTGVHIDIEKRIPMCAGLAGGSTDAAAVFVALNDLHGEIFSRERLCALGKKVGADVPFCILGKAAFAQGIGEVLAPIEPLPECYIVVAIGNGEEISTKWAFSQLDNDTDREIQNVEGILDAMSSGDLECISSRLYNVFETVSPHNQQIKSIMMKHSACGVLMSGSGPSIFGLFKTENDAKNAEQELKNEGNRAFFCKPIR